MMFEAMGDFRAQAEQRAESVNYADAVVDAFHTAAIGAVEGDASGIAALEIAAGAWARGFQAARIEPASAARFITPSILGLIGRELCRRGDAVLRIAVAGGRIRLDPVGYFNVRGRSPDPARWRYFVSVPAPSGQESAVVPSAGMVHVRYAFSSLTPWRGIAPISWASATGKLAGNLETRLAQEAGAPVGAFLPVPQDGGDGGDEDPLADLKSDIRGAKGRHLLVETTAQGWGEGKVAAPQSDYKAMRFGANPPVTLPSLRSDAALSVLAACGVPVSLATDADGTSQRESWRRFVMGTVEPLLSGPVREELAAKLEIPELQFDLRGLWAHDLQGRAASFKAMVAGGMDAGEAAAKAGLLE